VTIKNSKAQLGTAHCDMALASAENASVNLSARPKAKDIVRMNVGSSSTMRLRDMDDGEPGSKGRDGDYTCGDLCDALGYSFNVVASLNGK
jgi:hypothetical protein